MTGSEAQERKTWDTYYGEEDYFFGTGPNTWLASKAEWLKPGMRVLLPADGEGRNSVWCAERGLVADAFDISPIAAKKAEKLAEKRGVQVNYAISSLDAWDWQIASHDAVILVFLNCAAPDMRSRLFARSIDALKPGGILLLTGYSERQLEYGTGGPSDARQLYSEAMLREAFNTLDILEIVDSDIALDAGPGHQGLSSVIGMVAKKPMKPPEQT
ncbi:class I SAM-dependent methyltransferase [Oxalobacter sp. OttesenSCG-928-P03]|nr:class I SAM-dependent methyltransferase [Oxalobacter sp. OttesenSCG-928-P03]